MMNKLERKRPAVGDTGRTGTLPVVAVVARRGNPERERSLVCRREVFQQLPLGIASISVAMLGLPMPGAPARAIPERLDWFAINVLITTVTL